MWYYLKFRIPTLSGKVKKKGRTNGSSFAFTKLRNRSADCGILLLHGVEQAPVLERLSLPLMASVSTALT